MIDDTTQPFTTQLVAQIGARLLELKSTLVTAESCTGGLIAATIVNRAGSSAFFKGGVIAYSNEIKMQLLGVSDHCLASFGAVSEQVVVEMAEGVRTLLYADYAIAVSGIAGPGGGVPQKPIGTIWVAVATPTATYTRLLHATSDRTGNIAYTLSQSLQMFLEYI